MPLQLCLRLLIPLLVTLSAPVSADNRVDAREQFRAGIQAFKEKNLEAARTYLEAASDLGMQSRALTYNLGVIYYKTGDYTNAERMFRQLTGTRQRSLAFYNLGLIALARDDTREARAAFHRVIAAGDGDNLTRLARAQLERLGDKAPLPPWQALLSLAAGYEDNIGLFPDAAPSTIDDTFLESVNAVSGYAYRHGSGGVKIDGQLYAREHTSEQRFDSHQLRLDVKWLHQLNDHRLYAGIGGDKLWYGGSTREHRGRILAGVVTPACALGGEKVRCSVSVRAEQINASSQYEAYDGRHYQLDARYRARLGDWSGGLRYRADYDDRKNLQTDQEYFSVSPLAHRIEAGTGYNVTSDFEVEGTVGYRYSFYRTPHRFRIPGGTLVINREDKRLSLAVNADYRINDTFSLLTTWRQVRNDSNIPRYDYRRSTVTLGVTVLL